MAAGDWIQVHVPYHEKTILGQTIYHLQIDPTISRLTIQLDIELF